MHLQQTPSSVHWITPVRTRRVPKNFTHRVSGHRAAEIFFFGIGVDATLSINPE
jgi:hypothetical protein